MKNDFQNSNSTVITNSNNNFQKKLNKKAKKYKSHEKFLIARRARQTINYIMKNTENFPNTYTVLKNRIVDSCYRMLENIYRANLFQDLNDKKEVMLDIQMLNYYFDEALRCNIITEKKYLNYAKYLREIDLMVRKWILYEKSG